MNEIKTIDQLIYLKKSNFFISTSLCFNLFSLAGVPPFIGFFGKFFIFLNLANLNLYLLIFIGLIFSVISSFYYLRIIKLLNFNNVKNWIFLINIDKKTSFLISFSFFFNLLFLFYMPFFLELFQFLFLKFFFFFNF